MNKEVFAVFDACARRYLRPFFADSIEEALRSFKTICNETEHQFHAHPQDFILFHLGHFDFELGKLDGLTEPHNLGMAAQMIEQQGPGLLTDADVAGLYEGKPVARGVS